MGRTNSIDTLKQQNQAFSDYMAQATANLAKRAADQRQPFLDAIRTIYGTDDQHVLGAGSNSDYKQASEFSIDSIDTMLNKVASAVFSGGAAPTGTVVGTAAEVAGVVTELASFQALALVAAKSFITQILGVFDTTASTSFHSAFSSSTLAPGLMLHVWNYGDAFQRADFFNNEFIIENMIEFQLIYSFAQAQTEQDIEYMDEHTKLTEDLEAKIVKMQETIDARVADIDTDLPDGQPDGWNARVTYLKNTLESYRAEVDKLVKGKQAAA